ncbi:hypothetical protein NA57DRAFT_58990 [Rhizodiscina lignyota]|uniref:Zn(2)-C6 fungal-type domain-containing protein n=1 Tax=Rhizodiscina lignyota TaxID=1504668 RepID=A0A9P4I8H4_9PEZI|nr:hypothetical protein NA57DRAFT_58990 [Rhizodiscina lignyota]
MPVLLRSKDAPGRKRRAHAKSRRGCGNCKLRRVKCDELKPSCMNCMSFGVSCNYAQNSSSLELAGESVFQLQTHSPQSLSLNETMRNMINKSLMQVSPAGGVDVYQLTEDDLQVLERCQARTISSLAEEKTVHIYRAEGLKLTCCHPFLMHATLAIAMMHERVMAGKTFKEQSTAEIYHSYQATATFRSKLSGPLTPSERDALWIATVLLSTMSLASIDATAPEEAWPLMSSFPTDLDWLEMIQGKNVVWKIADLARPDSAVGRMVIGFKDSRLQAVAKDASGLQALPQELLELLGLDTCVVTKNNPYYRAALCLGNLFGEECNIATLALFYVWIMSMEAEFKQLLRRKDPRALLLLAYWFRKVRSRHVWFLWQRSVLECQAICTYLEQNHSDMPHLENLLLGLRY